MLLTLVLWSVVVFRISCVPETEVGVVGGGGRFSDKGVDGLLALLFSLQSHIFGHVVTPVVVVSCQWQMCRSTAVLRLIRVVHVGGGQLPPASGVSPIGLLSVTIPQEGDFVVNFLLTNRH